MVDSRLSIVGKFLSVKIRLFRLIRVPIIFCLFSTVAFSQVKIGLKGHYRSEFDLWVNQVSGDTAFVKVSSPRGHAAKKLTTDDFLITRQKDTAEILSCTPAISSSANDLAITFIL